MATMFRVYRIDDQVFMTSCQQPPTIIQHNPSTRIRSDTTSIGQSPGRGSKQGIGDRRKNTRTALEVSRTSWVHERGREGPRRRDRRKRMNNLVQILKYLISFPEQPSGSFIVLAKKPSPFTAHGPCSCRPRQGPNTSIRNFRIYHILQHIS